jgi:DNA-binding NarL/FixJ family response regulator
MMRAKPIRILLVDDHTLVRAGIRALIEGIEEACIVAEADNGREAIALARTHTPDIIVMDIPDEGAQRYRGHRP